MAVKSGFFNSVNGDRKYDARWFAEYFASFIGNGVFPNPSNNLQVVEYSNMRTAVKIGKGWINGYFIVNDSDYTVQHDVADGVLNRIDRIVLRLNYLTRQIEIVVKKGAFAFEPVAPNLQRDTDAYELALADVYISNGATVITQANITDLRLNDDLCGIVHGTVDQVDTTTLFNQYQSWMAQQELNYQNDFESWSDEQREEFEIWQSSQTYDFATWRTAQSQAFETWMQSEKVDFETWFNQLQVALDGDVAANLANEIADIRSELSEANRETTTLTSGVSVVTANQNSPVDVEIHGRTLTSLGNATLDSTKLYVLADKRTKVKWADGATVNGIAKFAGKSERPSIIRVANFEGKVSGSNIENPHKASWSTSTQLVTPSSSTTEFINSTNNAWNDYKRIFSLDGSILTNTATVSSSMAQHLLSFNIIEAVERNIGKIPKSTVAEKVQWLKDNISKLTANWYGFGSSVGGNRATFSRWETPSNSWVNNTSLFTHTSSSVSNLRSVVSAEAVSYVIGNDGIVHYLAYAEPSDGVTPSTINTDYVELEVELKPTATLETSKVPLYEVTQDEYNKILVDWDESKVTSLYPSVEGTKHLTNPYVIAEGENLLPPLFEWPKIHSNLKILEPYEAELNANDNYQSMSIPIKVINGQTYTITRAEGNGKTNIYKTDIDGSSTLIGTVVGTRTFTVDDSYKGYVSVRIGNEGDGVGTFTFKNPMLTLGTTPKPFVPRNPSRLFADVTLGQIGTNKDLLYRNDGKWFVRKVINTDVTPPTLLPSPQTIDVTDKVEGDIVLSSQTQVQVGSEGAQVLNLELTYSNNIRSALDDVIKKQSDIATAQTSLREDFESHVDDDVNHVRYAVDTGTANEKIVTLNPTPNGYVDGMAIAFKNAVRNTGAVTINVNGLGPKPIVKSNGSPLTADYLLPNSIYSIRYNASNGNFMCVGEGGGDYGDVTPDKVLWGTSFGTDEGLKTGTMPNRGAVTITPGQSEQVIPAGYHNGSGVVSAVSFDASKVLTGTTIAGKAGTMPNQGAKVITPSIVNQVIPAGWHNGSGYVVGDPDLIPSNILSGKNIFGVIGTASGIKIANGTIIASSTSIPFIKEDGTSSGMYYVEVTGLTFTPSEIIVYQEDNINQSIFGTKITGDSYINLIADTIEKIQVTGNAYINKGFRFPVLFSSNKNYRWVAYGQ